MSVVFMASVDPAFLVYVDQLRDGHAESIDYTVDPAFIEVEESALRFLSPVCFRGEAYLAHEELILDLKVETEAQIPCRICNEWVAVPIKEPRLLHVEPISSLKRGHVDLRPILREALLLQVPHVVECNDGVCPQRKEIQSFLKEEDADSDSEIDGYQPFKQLDWE